MKTYVIKSEKTMNNAAKNMLGSMALHFHKSVIKINFTLILAHIGSLVCDMMNDFIALIDIANPCITDKAGIRHLSSLLREKGGLVKNNVISTVDTGYL